MRQPDHIFLIGISSSDIIPGESCPPQRRYTLLYAPPNSHPFPSRFSLISFARGVVGGKEAHGLIFSIHFLNVFPVGKRPQYTDHYFSQYKKTAASHAQ